MTTKTRSGPDKSVYLVNLGCPKNLVDGEVMLGLLADAGYTLSPRPGTGRGADGQYVQLY